MIKLPNLSKMINPVYVLIGGVLGGSIPFIMYMGNNFSVSKQSEGLQFTHALSFPTWVFLLSVLFSGISIILIPGWKVYSQLYSSVVNDGQYQSWKIIGVLATSTIMYLLVLLALFALAGRVIQLPKGDFLDKINLRFTVVYLYSALGFLPIMFSIILINYLAEIMSNDIAVVMNDEKKIVEFIQKYLHYRNILQICLITSGIILSLNPIITAAYISIWQEIGIFTRETFPSQGIIIYGLIITLLLIFIYVPTYFNITNVGRELRDAKYPYPQQLDDLKGVLEKRKTLDELLQTNIGITENLKNGIFTLSPLVSGLIAGLLGFK
jgi:hypothetical protein